MKVKDLIEFLQTQPQDLDVAYALYSEYCLLDADEIRIERLVKARPDGWIHSFRPDGDTQLYLVFPGN